MRCLAAGLLGANTLLGSPLSREDLSDLAAELEGHPDNTAPALLGGLVTAVMDGERVYTVSVPVSERIRFAVFIPEFELRTEAARAASVRSSNSGMKTANRMRSETGTLTVYTRSPSITAVTSPPNRAGAVLSGWPSSSAARSDRSSRDRGDPNSVLAPSRPAARQRKNRAYFPVFGAGGTI